MFIFVKFKNYYTPILASLLGLFFSSMACAKSPIYNRNYTYFQANGVIDLYDYYYISNKTYSSNDQEWHTDNKKLDGRKDLNVNISVGVYSKYHEWELETQIGQDTLDCQTINGQKVTNKNSGSAFSVMDYLLVNLGKTFFHLPYDCLFYGKAGVGVALINNIRLDDGAVNVPTPLAALRVGVRSQITNHLDIDASIGIVANYAKRTTVSTGSQIIYQIVKSQLSLGVRYKL